MTYLEEAAGLLRDASTANETRARKAEAMHRRDARDETAVIMAEVNSRRLAIANGFIRLAAIEAGLSPCYHGTMAPGKQGPEGASS